MSGNVMKVSAWLMVVVALILGVYAYKLAKQNTAVATTATQQSQQQASTAVVEAPYKAVIAVKTIPAGAPVDPEAVKLQPVWTAPEGGFDRIDALAGRIPTEAIAVGEPVREKHFAMGSLMAQKLEPGQRAVAIKLNDQIGVGGYAQPGDYVDVLTYLKSDSKQNDNTQARLLLRKVKVLAMGVQAKQGEDGNPTQGARFAVLSVPEEKALDLMLAANFGDIRLSLHGSKDEVPLAEAGAKTPAEREVVTLKELTALKKSTTAPTRRSRSPQVVIYRGGEREAVTVR